MFNNTKNIFQMTKICILFCITFLISCTAIKNTPGFYTGYKNLSEAQKNQVIVLDDGFDLNKLKNDGNIYSIKASHLKQSLKKHDSSLVYYWSPNCSGSACILISACQKYCNENNYNKTVAR